MKFSIFSFFKRSFTGWLSDEATVWCAALAYYTVFSLGPLLLIVTSVGSLAFSQASIEKEIHDQMQDLMGNEGAKMLDTMIAHTKMPGSKGGILGTIFGILTLLLSAIGGFSQLQGMLNHIWGVTTKRKKGILNLIRSRLLNFSMVGVIAFLLFLSLIASTAITFVGRYLGNYVTIPSIYLESVDFLSSFAIITLLFAFIFKILPDVQIKWRNVWMGAVITSLLFTIGKTGIGLYISHSDPASGYGAAASLIILLLWIYYSSLILFLGAEFTKTLTVMRGEKIIPKAFSTLKKSK